MQLTKSIYGLTAKITKYSPSHQRSENAVELFLFNKTVYFILLLSLQTCWDLYNRSKLLIFERNKLFFLYFWKIFPKENFYYKKKLSIQKTAQAILSIYGNRKRDNKEFKNFELMKILFSKNISNFFNIPSYAFHSSRIILLFTYFICICILFISEILIIKSQKIVSHSIIFL